MSRPMEGLMRVRVGDRSIADGGVARPSAGTAPEGARRDRVRTSLAGLAIGLPRSTKRLLMVAADVVLLPMALWTAMALRTGELFVPLGYVSVLLCTAILGVVLLSLTG